MFAGNVCALRELIFAIRTDLFFLLGINFDDFQKVQSNLFNTNTKGPWTEPSVRFMEVSVL